MRELNAREMELVAGGNDTINERIADACEGQPDSTNVTVTLEIGGEINGLGLGGVSHGTTVSVTANCGDFRAQSGSEGS